MRKLTSREKKLLGVLGTIAALVLLYVFVISPALDLRTSSEKDAGDSASRLRKMDQLYDEYKKIRQEKTRYLTLLENKNEKTTELIQQCSTGNNIDKNIAYTRKTQSNVQNKYIRVTTDVKIEGVAIQPLIKFINDLESTSDLTRVQYIRINKGLKGTDTYDALIKIDSFINK